MTCGEAIEREGCLEGEDGQEGVVPRVCARVRIIDLDSSILVRNEYRKGRERQEKHIRSGSNQITQP